MVEAHVAASTIGLLPALAFKGSTRCALYPREGADLRTLKWRYTLWRGGCGLKGRTLCSLSLSWSYVGSVNLDRLG